MQKGKRQYRNMSDEQRQTLSNINKGKKLSQETKNKISKSMQEYWSQLDWAPTTDYRTGNNNGENTSTM